MQVIWARPLSLTNTQLNCTVLRRIKDFELNLYVVVIEKELTRHFICWITSFGDLRAALPHLLSWANRAIQIAIVY